MWKSHADLWPKDEGEYIVNDYYSVELENLVRNNKYQDETGAVHPLYADQMRKLAACLDSSWDKVYSRFCQTQVCDKDGKTLKETETSFSITLKTCAWLPAEKCQYSKILGGRVEKLSELVMCEPSQLYLRNPNVESLLSDKVLYMDVPMNNGNFLQFLKINCTVSMETMKNYLLSWSQREKPELPTVFHTSLFHMKNVYRYIGDNLSKHDLQSLLREQPIVFVPDRSTNAYLADASVYAGKMLNRSEVWLVDKTGLFDKNRGLLEEYHLEIGQKRTIASYYSNCRQIMDLFKQEGAFDQSPKITEFIELLSLICSVMTPKDTRTLSDVLKIFETIGQALTAPLEGHNEQSEQMAQNALKSMVKQKLKNEKV